MKIVNKWVFPSPVEIPGELRSNFSGSDFLLESLVRRGINTSEAAAGFLDFHKYTPQSPESLPDMTKAVTRIQSAIKKHETIGVWGDFDVDGQTATAVLVDTLRKLGAEVLFHIPVRSRESHGITLSALKQFLTPSMKLIVSCDTGISASDAAVFLQSNGVDLIITDHHSLPADLPDAYAIIDPQFLAADHPLRTLAGVGTAYKLAEALLDDSNLAEYALGLHDLVALGSVADLAVLRGDTRFLTQSGLDRLRTAPRLFLIKMAEMLDLPLNRLNEEHIGFYLAPRMNAVGRLDDANPMVNFLLSNDVTEVKIILNRMEALNASRRVLVNQVFQGCLAQLDANPALLDQPLLILAHPEWPAGVIGIAAGRLAELTFRPVILLSNDPNGTLRGSARSIEGIDITTALTQNRELLLSFGGHPMAAGLSLKVENLAEFRARMQFTVAEMAAQAQVEPEIQIETPLNLEQVNFDLLADLDRLAPFGPGNPAPVFAASGLTLENTLPMGRNSEHLQASVADENDKTFKVLWWQGADLPLPEGKFDLAYTAHLNIYRGTPQIQYEWVDFRSATESSPARQRKSKKQIRGVDYRGLVDLTPEIRTELAHNQALLWQEGTNSFESSALDHTQLKRSPALAILSIPPSSKILIDAFNQVNPATVYFFAQVPPENNLKVFLKEVGAALKQKLREGDDSVSPDYLAAQFASTPEMILLSLKWYAAKGLIQIVQTREGQIQISTGADPDPEKVDELEKSLTHLADEISAFRRYYIKASLASLVNLGE